MGRLETDQRPAYQEEAHEFFKIIRTHIEHPPYTIATRQRQVTTSEGSHYFIIAGISQEEWEIIQKNAPHHVYRVTENPQRLTVEVNPNSTKAFHITFYDLRAEKMDWYGIPEDYLSRNGIIHTDVQTPRHADIPGMVTYADIVAHAILQNRTAECPKESLKRIHSTQSRASEGPPLFPEDPLDVYADGLQLAPLHR